MTNKHFHNKTTDPSARFGSDKTAESQPFRPAHCGNGNSCHFGDDKVPASAGMRFTELFISSSKLISVYTEKSWQPPTDIYETDKEIVIRCEIAGMKPEEILISCDDNRLLITGCRDERDARIKRNFRQMEINYGKFEKVIDVYCGIESEHAAASYKDGFLEIVIPKSNPSGTGLPTGQASRHGKSAGQHTRPNAEGGQATSASSDHVTTIRHIEIISQSHITTCLPGSTGGPEDE
jgi:HSP20 family protein